MNQSTDHMTTVLGGLAAILTYWGQTGFVIPASRQEVAALAGSAALAALGYLTNKR